MNVGIKLDGLPAECLLDLAPQIERAGFDELWVVEDYGLAGGFVQAATALARTRSIRVGIGIAPAAVRNVMYLSMEIAGLARMHPDRFIAGIGHGMPEWLHQVGAYPESLMTTLEEVATAARGILHGETVTFHGRHLNLDAARLTHPPTPPPPLNLGVRGPKGLRLASRIADGTILAEGSGPQYVADVRHLAGPTNHRITVFSWLSIDHDGELAVLAQGAGQFGRPGHQLGAGVGGHGRADEGVLQVDDDQRGDGSSAVTVMSCAFCSAAAPAPGRARRADPSAGRYRRPSHRHRLPATPGVRSRQAGRVV
jgi:alkanesulfonate monooxygenase SsuD/methylene tetrahydromethanopterin reductase-like flavin-dependent oxidoreductase (luciferase family)